MYEHVAIVVGDSTPERLEQVLASHPELTMIGTYYAKEGVVTWLNEFTSYPSLAWLGTFEMLPSLETLNQRTGNVWFSGRGEPGPFTVILLPVPPSVRDGVIEFVKREGHRLILVDQDPSQVMGFEGMMFDCVGDSIPEGTIEVLSEPIFLFQRPSVMEDEGRFHYIGRFDSMAETIEYCAGRFPEEGWNGWSDLVYFEGWPKPLEKPVPQENA